MNRELVNHRKDITKTLANNRGIFKAGEPIDHIEVSPIINNRVHLYICKDRSQGYQGIALKEGGFICGHEVIDVSDSNEICLLSYSYNFSCNKYSYACLNEDGNLNINYNFRYDKDEAIRKSHPKNHLHVLHDLPIFETNEFSFNSFMKIIRDTFFDDQENRIDSNLWERQ